MRAGPSVGCGQARFAAAPPQQLHAVAVAGVGRDCKVLREAALTYLEAPCIPSAVCGQSAVGSYRDSVVVCGRDGASVACDVIIGTPVGQVWFRLRGRGYGLVFPSRRKVAAPAPRHCRNLPFHRGVGYSLYILSGGVACTTADTVIVRYSSLDPRNVRGFSCFVAVQSQESFVADACVRSQRWITWISDAG